MVSSWTFIALGAAVLSSCPDLVSGARVAVPLKNSLRAHNATDHALGLDQLDDFATTTTTTFAGPSEEGMKALVIMLCLTFLPAIVALILGITQVIPYVCPYEEGSTKPNYSLYQRIFRADKNIAFAMDAELALRGAIFGMLAAAPFWYPDMFFLVSEKRYTSFAVVMFVYTLYKSVGDTINFTFVGLLGTLLAATNVWVMNGFFPGGVQSPDSPMFWPGLIDTIVFAIVILSLNIENATRVFALSWHTYFMMSFLNPNDAGGWSVAFTIDMKGPAVSAFLQSGIGCGLAIIATMFPFPIFALDKARTVAAKMTITLADAYSTCVECYCADSKQPIIEDRVKHDMRTLQSCVLTLSGYVASSWWECLGIGRAETVRVFLGKLDHSIRELYDKLLAICHSLDLEDYSLKHQQTMALMRPSLTVLAAEAGKMLSMCTLAAIDGSIDDDEAAALDIQKKKTIAAIELVTKTFEEKVSGILDVETMDENAFCLSFCAYGRTAVEFVDVMKNTVEKTQMEVPDVLSTFRIPIFDKVYRNMVLRNSMSYLLALYVGYNGYSLIIKSYNAGPATVVSLLISTGLGSSVMNNLNRLQGVVLGTFFGQLAYALLAWCSISGYVKVAAFIFFWLLLTLFPYYNAKDFSTVACLLAAFGCQGILLGCSDDVFNPGSVTHMITNTVLGVTFMSLIDIIFVLESPSQFAKKALVEAWEVYRNAMGEIFNPTTQQVRKHGGKVLGMISTASSASGLADKEPRIWKTPFKYDLFQDIVAHCQELRCSLCCMETVSAASGEDNGNKAVFMTAMYKLPSFEIVRADFDQYILNVEDIYNIFLHETDEYFTDVAGFKPLKEGKSALDVAKANMENLAKELTTFAQQQKGVKQSDIEQYGAGFKTLENNVMCKISMSIFCLNWQFSVLYGMKHRMLAD